MEPLHFHRQEHLPQHDNQYAAPAPNATTKPREVRKYKLLDQTSTQKSTIPQSSDTEDISDLTNSFRRAAITAHTDESGYHQPSPEYIERALQRWKQDERLMFNFKARERRNPFPGIDMNKGWNRARCDSRLYFLENYGTVEEKMKIQQGFKGYSLWAQLEPYELDVKELEGIFDRVFVGETGVKEGWARTPGSWWAQRKNLFLGDRGVLYEETLAAQTGELFDKIERWSLQAKERRNCKCIHRNSLSKQYVEDTVFGFWVFLFQFNS